MNDHKYSRMGTRAVESGRNTLPLHLTLEQLRIYQDGIETYDRVRRQRQKKFVPMQRAMGA